jgi:hypothetical protein
MMVKKVLAVEVCVLHLTVNLKQETNKKTEIKKQMNRKTRELRGRETFNDQQGTFEKNGDFRGRRVEERG